MIDITSPLTSHLVRIGAMGHVGLFTAVDALTYARSSKVVCRTCRGLEIGEVLGHTQRNSRHADSDGSVLRALTEQDELLNERLERYRDDAFVACRAELEERNIAATLVDVEHLFDGKTLYFYFLGDVPAEVEQITGELAEAYDAKAQFRQFTDTVTQGCGPGCGTEEAPGCNSACDLCAIASDCKSAEH